MTLVILMSKPPTMVEAAARGLCAQPFTKSARAGGVHTFSNGTDWECWYYKTGTN